MTKVLWTQKQDVGPLPRTGNALAYDAARKRHRRRWLLDARRWSGIAEETIADVVLDYIKQHGTIEPVYSGRIVQAP